MGKRRKQAKPQPVVSQRPASAISLPTSQIPAQSPASCTGEGALAQRLGWQLAAILGLSVLLGFAFNAANPIGVRFGSSAIKESAGAGSPGHFNLLSTRDVIATVPPAPGLVVSNTSHPPATVPQPAPAPVMAQLVVTSPPTRAPVTVVVPVTNQSTPVTTTNTVAVVNPTPTHWREVKPLLVSSNIVLVDVRARAAYDAGHIPGALSLPEGSPPGEFAAFASRYPTNTPLILYCSSTSCSMSLRVAKKMMAEYKYVSVKYMTGGYQEYQREEMAAPQPATQPGPQPPPSAQTNLQPKT